MESQDMILVLGSIRTGPDADQLVSLSATEAVIQKLLGIFVHILVFARLSLKYGEHPH